MVQRLPGLPFTTSSPHGHYSPDEGQSNVASRELREIGFSHLNLAQAETRFADFQRLGGRRVDLRTAQDLSRHFRDQVIRRAEVQYAA